ncbi:hypothetical protein EBS43_07560 [bacterium]|jgi:hypothetical protein|nr:hypothetical protein [bacterium]
MKNPIKISFEFGIVIRKDAITKKQISKEKIAEVFEGSSPLDESDVLLSYGPHFGAEAMEELGKRLSKLGLEYVDDFFYFQGDFPDWAEFSVNLKS